MNNDVKQTIREALDVASQLAEIAGDWNLNDVEINGEMVAIHEVNDVFIAALAALDEQPAALTKRVADLEETLAFAAQYKGIEARACPLCHYENGVFVDRCQMHKDMDALTKQVAELEAALAAATRYVPVEDNEYEGMQILEDGTFISFRDRDELGQPCWSAYTLGDLVVCRVTGEGGNG